jgi:hypothetical protein
VRTTVSLFHRHHEDPQIESPEDIFTVEMDDGALVDYRRDDFDQVFSTKDHEEAQRQIGIGWLLIDQHEEHHQIRPDIDGEFPAVTGQHLGGGTGLFTGGESVSVWTLGYLNDDAQGEPHDAALPHRSP